MRKEIECKVTGRVQLVMFRDFATRRARRFGLVGTVQNLEDGSVWVVAQGDEEILLEYIEELKKGPILARVDGVEVSWREPQKAFSGFAIVY